MRTNPWEAKDLPAKETEKEKPEREEDGHTKLFGRQVTNLLPKEWQGPLLPVLLLGHVR